MKQAQGNTLWIIVVAIIALIAGAVLIVMFTGRAGDANRSLESCVGKGGVCEEKTTPVVCKNDKLPAEAFFCAKTITGKKQVCCIG